MIGFGDRTEPVGHFVPLVCATDTRTLWIRRSLSHSLLARKDAALTFYRYRDRSHGYHTAVGRRTYKRAENPGNFVLPPIRPMFAQNMPCRSSGSKLMDWTMASPNPAWRSPTMHDVIHNRYPAPRRSVPI